MSAISPVRVRLERAEVVLEPGHQRDVLARDPAGSSAASRLRTAPPLTAMFSASVSLRVHAVMATRLGCHAVQRGGQPGRVGEVGPHRRHTVDGPPAAAGQAERLPPVGDQARATAWPTMPVTPTTQGAALTSLRSLSSSARAGSHMRYSYCLVRV